MAQPTLLSQSGRPIASLISADEIAARVAQLGRQITEDYRALGGTLELIGVLKGSVIFLADLCRHIGLPITIDSPTISPSRNAPYPSVNQAPSVVSAATPSSRV